MLVVVGAGVIVRGVAPNQAATAPGQTSDRLAAPDRDLGLGKTTLTDDRVPPVFVFTEEMPGDTQLLPRSFDGAPPLIPHSVDGLIPITREENLCVFCHAIGSTDPGNPPQAPRSHWIDWRAAPGVVRDTVAGASWACTACHVAQSTAPPLVVNTFGSSRR